MTYKPIPMSTLIEISCFYSFYYKEYTSSHYYPGETHDFWECLYVDKGEVMVTAGKTQHLLKSGMVIFHKPNEFHSFYAHGGSAPNVIVFSFGCDSEPMKWFESKILNLNDDYRNLLALMINQARRTYEYPFHSPFPRIPSAPVGSEQLIKLYLELFLVRILIERPDNVLGKKHISSLHKNNEALTMVEHINHILRDRLHDKITLDELSQIMHVSKTKLKTIYKQITGNSIAKTLNHMKIEQAKTLIRENQYNITEISNRLGFGSIHQFSKTFKKTVNMTPTQYAQSVKSRTERYLTQASQN